MNGLIDGVLSRARTTLSIMAITILAGVIAYVNLPKEAEPDVPFPFVLVSISHPGISPVDAERLLIKPMEQRLQSLDGVVRMSAKALEGIAYITLEFDVDFDGDQALIDVREQVDIARADLPADTEEPLVLEQNAALFPVMAILISGDTPERKLEEIARKLQSKLEALPDVLSADLSGNREELLEVIIDPNKLETYNVSQAELINAVTNNNRLVAAGALDTRKGKFSVKVPGLVETASDVFDIPIKVSGDGVVTLSDLADIRRTFKDPEGYTHANGKDAIGIQIVKRLGSNIILTNKSVRALVEHERQFWPDGVNLTYTLDRSIFIEDALTSLQASIMTAISLVMIIVVGALGLRSGLMVGIAIPTSFLLGFLVLSSMGETINQMTMFGLVLSVGMLVDGAIVVVEYADRKMAEGLHRKVAYGMAAKRMFWPIVSSTFTTLAAFLPMLFWPGITGKFMSYLPSTLIITLCASLVVALIFLPVFGSVFGRHQKKTSKADNALQSLALGETGAIEDIPGYTGTYARFISKAVRQPLKVLGATLLVIFTVLVGFSFTDVKTTFFIEGEPEIFAVIVGGRGNLSPDEINELVYDVEREILDIDGIRSVFTTTGGVTQISAGPETPPPDDMIGRINIELKDWRLRPPGREIINEVRQRLHNFPGLRIEVRVQEDGPPVGKDVQLEMRSEDGDLLLQEATRIRNYFDTVPGLIELEDSRPLPGIQWELHVDREQAGRFGADITQVGVMVQLITNGVLLGKYRPDDAEDEVDIRVRYPLADRNINQLDSLRIQTTDGLVPISNFVTRTPEPQVNKIDRIDSQQVIYVRANTPDNVNVAEKVAEIEDYVSKAKIDPRVSWRFKGADEESEKSGAFLRNAMFLALFLMGMILLTQFNSFYHVFLTLSSVVVATIGVLLGIIITGQNFSMVMTGVGIVALAGIVVNNNIVLIDTFHRLCGAGYDIFDAATRTAAQRLRPVLLTTITTIFGLLPMALQVNVDFISREISLGGPTAIWWVELSTAVIFGLAFATLVTLVLTPSLLALPQHLRNRGILKRKHTEAPANKTIQPAE